MKALPTTEQLIDLLSRHPNETVSIPRGGIAGLRDGKVTTIVQGNGGADLHRISKISVSATDPRLAACIGADAVKSMFGNWPDSSAEVTLCAPWAQCLESLETEIHPSPTHAIIRRSEGRVFFGVFEIGKAAGQFHA